MHVLVTGVSGVGKTHIARYMRSKGDKAFDGDIVGYWIRKKDGKRIKPTAKQFAEISEIDWVWDVKKLKSMLKRSKTMYVFGAPHNLLEVARLFDKVYYMHASKKLILKRLTNEARDNPFGQSAEQRRMTLIWLKFATKRAKEQGWEFIDASLPPARIRKIITRARTC